MKKVLWSLLLAPWMVMPAAAIDLACEDMARELVARYDEARLLAADGEQDRALAIARDVCTGVQVDAREQHEKATEQALKNWFMEDTGGKPGNDRLDRLKR